MVGARWRLRAAVHTVDSHSCRPRASRPPQASLTPASQPLHEGGRGERPLRNNVMLYDRGAWSVMPDQTMLTDHAPCLIEPCLI